MRTPETVYRFIGGAVEVGNKVAAEITEKRGKASEWAAKMVEEHFPNHPFAGAAARLLETFGWMDERLAKIATENAGRAKEVAKGNAGLGELVKPYEARKRIETALEFVKRVGGVAVKSLGSMLKGEQADGGEGSN